VRSGVWLAGGYPNNDDSNYGDYKHTVCVITAVSIYICKTYHTLNQTIRLCKLSLLHSVSAFVIVFIKSMQCVI